MNEDKTMNYVGGEGAQFSLPKFETIALYPIPDWVKDNPDQQSCHRHPRWGFWYPTGKDYGYEMATGNR